MNVFNYVYAGIVAAVIIGFFVFDAYLSKTKGSVKFTMNNIPNEISNSNDFPCVHRDYCGGCTYNGEAYIETLKHKEAEVLEVFKEKAGLVLFNQSEENNKVLSTIDLKGLGNEVRIFDGRYEGIEGCQYKWQFQYRNKMEYTFGDLVKDGELELGMHKKGNFLSIVTVDHCQLVPDDFNLILGYTLVFAKSSELKHYHKKTHKGVFRNLIVRRGVRTGEILVDLVTSSEADGGLDYDANGNPISLKALDVEQWKNGLLNLKLSDNNKIVGIMHTINDNIADTVNCDEQRILFGRDYYYEEICGLRFKVNIFSFFQTNVNAVERLYTEAVSLLPDLKGKVVYDLFCGTGTISQIVAKDAKEVIGVEIVEDSVEAARVNTQLNGIENCRFICGDVYEVLNQATEKADSKEASVIDKAASGIDITTSADDIAVISNRDDIVSIPSPDVIIVDPPRVGLRTKAVNKIASYGVPEILYISCNPKTLAMDIADFKPLGYEPTYIKAYDNFPWTKHCEAAVLLRLADPKKANAEREPRGSTPPAFGIPPHFIDKG